MAQSKIVLNGGRDIPLNKLVLSQKNVRRIKNGQTIEQLAEDIANRGLIQSLNVRPVLNGEGQETGLYEVPAGGRRLLALQHLAKTKRLAKNAPVPCIVKTDGSPEEDSLAENTMREALHPLDQFQAFKTLIEQDMSVDDVAARFFVTPLIVRQRLKLAAVSPRLLEVYAADKMSLQQLMAFTVSNDHARQEQTWATLEQGYNKEPYTIRRLLMEHSVNADERRAVFVGAEAYEAAGGTIARDLFQNHDRGGWLEDVPLLDRLAREKLDAIGAEIRAEGWKWVEVALDFPYGHTSGLRRLAPVAVALEPEDQARADALRQEYDNLHQDYEGVDELPEAVDQRLGEIEEQIDALDAKTTRFDPEWIARAGAFVSIDASGCARVERGFVRAEDIPAAPEPASPSAEPGATPYATGAFHRSTFTIGGDPSGAGASEPEEEDDGERPIPERLLTEITTHRTMALRRALSLDPDSAFLAVLHAMVLKLFYPMAYSADTCLEIQVTSRSPDRAVPGLAESHAAAELLRAKEGWAERLPSKPKALWDYLLQLDGDSRADLFALCAGFSVFATHQPNERRPDAMAHADRLAELVGLDMTEHWQPTAADFFSRVTKGRILAAVREAKGESSAQLIDHLKKGDMAQEAERLVQGTGWLPQPLRTPGQDYGTMRAVLAAATAPIEADAPQEPAGAEADALPAFLTGEGDAGEDREASDEGFDLGPDVETVEEGPELEVEAVALARAEENLDHHGYGVAAE